jgi:V/A-type H+-transporting ATPase subunit B
MLDVAWKLFAKHFTIEEVNIKKELTDKYWK